MGSSSGPARSCVALIWTLRAVWVTIMSPFLVTQQRGGRGRAQTPAAASGVAVTRVAQPGDLLLELARAGVVDPGGGASPERWEAIEAAVRRAIRRAVGHGRSEATLRAYAGDWRHFAGWCRAVGLDPLPAAGATVAGYVAELAFPPEDRAAGAVSTITRCLAAIGQVHSLAGY